MLELPLIEFTRIGLNMIVCNINQCLTDKLYEKSQLPYSLCINLHTNSSKIKGHIVFNNIFFPRIIQLKSQWHIFQQ